jgi:two-component system response regulator FlrC
MARILVADDEPGLREFMVDSLELEGHAVTAAADGAEASRLLDNRGFDLVITDLKMPRLDGMALVHKLRAEQPETQIIVLTAHGTVESAVEAMKLGAFDYLQKPIGSPDELCQIAARAIERRRLLDFKDRVERDPPLAAELELTHGDPAMTPVVDAIGKVARTQATVLLLGDSGTGKEIAARTIHQLSDRRGGPFMALNCAAVAETLLESELFGHEKGAFTGASDRRRGRVELASGGTFFLDEVGELSPALQAKLLRVIQERTFERVGGTRTLESDVRWIAATNRDLRAMIEAGSFREDLYHRIAVFPIRLPPLRERAGDLLPIARVLLARIARELHRQPPSLSTSAERKLLDYSWPGNVRELRNALERAVILSDGDVVDAEHIWLDASPAKPATNGASVKSLADLERDGIVRALEAVDGNRRRAAELLGIGERTLYDKLKRHGLS